VRSARLSQLPAMVLLSAVVLPLPVHPGGRAHARHAPPSTSASQQTTNGPLPAGRGGQRRPHRTSVIVHTRTPAPPARRPAPPARHPVRPPSVARAAGDPGVTIADFHFSPGTTTVHVGDAITWTNDGPSPHSATANNGSFDTGVLQKGASASHTFTQAGTFTYFCKVHPFMHGTIVVLAAATTTTTTSTTSTSSGTGTAGTGGTGSTGGRSRNGGGTGSGQPASSSGSAPATSSGSSSNQSLPATGLNLALSVSLALGLVGLGLALRRAARDRAG
jgi:plastocyanin